MKTVMWTMILCCIFSLCFLGCNKEPSPADTVKAAQSNKALDPAKMSGGCENELQESPWQTLYWYPDKGEAFLTTDDSVHRLPISVTAKAETRLEFNYRGALERGEEMVTLVTGSLIPMGTQKWKFEFQTLKDAICRPVPVPNFYKKLPELGIPAGKYLRSQTGSTVTILPEMQKVLFEEKGGKLLQVYYRVLSYNAESGAKIAQTFTAPDQSKTEPWMTTQVSMVGETVIWTFKDGTTFQYALLK